MKTAIRKLFNIYPGEEKNALHFAILGFIWAVGVSLGWKNSDALFLLNVGADKLPIAYGIIACSMILIAAVMIYAYDKFRTDRIFLANLSVGITFYAIVGVCLRYEVGFESKMIWYALRVFGWVFFCIINTNFWTFIDQFYHLRDSKRLFTLFASAVFIGFSVTGVLMQTGLPEFQDVTFIIIGVLILTMLWVMRIAKTIQPIQSEHDIELSKTPVEEPFKQTLLSVWRSKFTVCLMLFNFLIFVSVILTEYNYMVSFEDHFGGGFDTPIANEEQAPLTLFLGKCIAAVNFFNLIFGLFIYSRLVRRFGLGNMLFATPLLLIITYTGWPFSTTLFFPLMAFFVSESTFYIIDDNNFNLLLNGVPTKLKYKIRVIIESFFEPTGTLVAALLLSTLTIDSKTISLIIALMLLAVSMIARKLYPKAIYSNLMENAMHFEKTPKEWLPSLSKKEKRVSENRLLSILKSGDPNAEEFAIEAILDFEDPSIVPKLLSTLESTSSETKKLFIEKLSFSVFRQDPKIIDQLLAWEESSTDLKGTLHLYLANLGLLSPQKALFDLKSAEPKLQAAGLIALKKSAGYALADQRILASEVLQDLLNSKDEEPLLMGLDVLKVDGAAEEVKLLFPYLHHNSLPVARRAARALSHVASPKSQRFIKNIIDHITSQSDNEFRISLLQALGKMADTSHVKEILLGSIHLRPSERRQMEKIIFQMGLKTVPSLLSITKDASLHDRSRLLAGKILGRLALPQLRANLLSICKEEMERAYFYFVHYHLIQESYPKQNLNVLKDALLAGYHSVIDFIIQLLGVSGEIEDSELLSQSMRSPNPKVRSQVVETLEKTCDISLFHLIQPLVDEIPLEEKLSHFKMPILSLEELLSRLRNSPSLVDQIAAAAVSSSLRLPGWRSTLKQQMHGQEEIFNHFAYEILET